MRTVPHGSCLQLWSCNRPLGERIPTAQINEELPAWSRSGLKLRGDCIGTVSSNSATAHTDEGAQALEKGLTLGKAPGRKLECVHHVRSRPKAHKYRIQVDRNNALAELSSQVPRRGFSSDSVRHGIVPP